MHWKGGSGHIKTNAKRHYTEGAELVDSVGRHSGAARTID